MIVSHKVFGDLPDTTLDLIQKVRVSKKQWDILLSKFGYVHPPFSEIEKFIRSKVSKGRYKPPKYL